MPCRDYESDHYNTGNATTNEMKKLKAQADKLARIACKAMTALEELEQQDFVLLQDDEVREWWAQHKIADAKAAAAKAERARVAKIKREALSKLSDEERKVLGIKV